MIFDTNKIKDTTYQGGSKMSLKEVLNNDIKTAMKARDKATLDVLRMIKSAVQKEELTKKAELTAEEELTILSREAKQRRDSLAEFIKAEREDLIEKTKVEISIVEKYLPKQLSAEEVQEIIRETAKDIEADSMKAFGKLMGAVMPKLKGKADGNVIKEEVKKFLS
ncbi:GatB/YqeY domain-containing protein [Granulicatella balaenopterae]